MKNVFKTLWWIIKKSAFGFVTLFAFNFLGTFINLYLQPNFLSYFFIGSLGIPGFIFVYIFNILFL